MCLSLKPRFGPERDIEQFERIQAAGLLQLPRALASIGNDRNLSNHLGRRAHFLESDQLYHLATDPLEISKLAAAANPGSNQSFARQSFARQSYARQLGKMKSKLAAELEKQGRPFGEFVPNSDSVPVSKIAPYVKQLARLKVIKKGFEVIGQDVAESPPKTISRQERAKQRALRKQQRDKRRQQNKSL